MAANTAMIIRMTTTVLRRLRLSSEGSLVISEAVVDRAKVEKEEKREYFPKSGVSLRDPSMPGNHHGWAWLYLKAGLKVKDQILKYMYLKMNENNLVKITLNV